jgi:hypothetical protein
MRIARDPQMLRVDHARESGSRMLAAIRELVGKHFSDSTLT